MSDLKIRAKFKCNTVTDNGTQKTASLTAVHGYNGENADYAKYTPNGQLTITVDSDTKGGDFFKPQKEYYLTFEDATPVIEQA